MGLPTATNGGRARPFRQALFLLFAGLLLLTAAACRGPAAPPRTPAAESAASLATSTASRAAPPSATSTARPSPTSTPQAPPSPSPTPSPTPTEPPTATNTETPSHTPEASPTYAILRAGVLVRANCRYGPGEPYLYKYGLVAGSNLEVIGRNEAGTWLLVRAIGGDNPCWVKASLMEVRGEVFAVEPTYTPLPQSPYYAPPSGVSATREGELVTLFWNPVTLRPGDASGQYPYLIEAWVCLQGELVFTPVGAYQPTAVIRDEAGCSQPSHGRLYAVEKHGYTRWLEIPWPPYDLSS